MNPIFLILYVVIITLLLTLFLPRLRNANPRLLWLSVLTGLAGLVIILVLTFSR